MWSYEKIIKKKILCSVSKFYYRSIESYTAYVCAVSRYNWNLKKLEITRLRDKKKKMTSLKKRSCLFHSTDGNCQSMKWILRWVRCKRLVCCLPERKCSFCFLNRLVCRKDLLSEAEKGLVESAEEGQFSFENFGSVLNELRRSTPVYLGKETG